MRRLLLGSDPGEIKFIDLEYFAMIDPVHAWRSLDVRISDSDSHSLPVFCRIEAFRSSSQASAGRPWKHCPRADRYSLAKNNTTGADDTIKSLCGPGFSFLHFQISFLLFLGRSMAPVFYSAMSQDKRRRQMQYPTRRH